MKQFVTWPIAVDIDVFPCVADLLCMTIFGCKGHIRKDSWGGVGLWVRFSHWYYTHIALEMAALAALRISSPKGGLVCVSSHVLHG